MSHKKKIHVFLLALVAVVGSQCQSDPKKGKALFEKEGDSWFQGGDAKWNFQDGELVGTSEGGSGFVMTKDSYEDFVMELEFFPDSTINSGVFVRCKNKELSNTECYEMNIWDLHPDQDSRTGAVVTRAKPLTVVHTLNSWNAMKVECQGDRQQVWINGSQTADIRDNDLEIGYIALQAAEHGQIRFRNIRLQPLP